MPVEVRIDRSLCQGTQSCVRRSPRSFSLDAQGVARAEVDPRDDEATLRAAADACPHFAIEVLANEEIDP